MSVAPPVQSENEADAREASNRRNLKALLNLIELGQGSFVFAMVEYDLPRLREDLIRQLKDASPGLQLLTIPLSPLPPLDQGRSFSVLDQIGELYSALSEGIKPDALLITGLEKVLPDDLEATDPASQARLTQAIQPLNLGRNILASTYECPVILFLPTSAMSVFVRYAPDISSWRSGYFQFQSDHDAVRAQIAEVASRGTGWWALWQIRHRSGDSLQREGVHLAALISDAEAMEMEPGLRVPLYRRMGWISASLGNRLLAGRMFERLLRMAGVKDNGLIREAGSDDADLARSAFAEMRRRLAEASRSNTEGQSQPSDAVPPAERLYWLREAEKGFLAIRKTRGRDVMRQEQARAALEAFVRAGHTVGAGLWGHEKELNRLLELITSVKVNFLTLWGAIGSGRSALVHQGLLPQLEERGGYLPVFVDRWDVPGASGEDALMAAPEQRVEQALSNVVCAAMPKDTPIKPQDAASLQNAASLHDACQMAVQTTNKTVVLICDRFEQFFMQRPLRRQREPFLKAVSACWADYNLPFKVLFILREEYLGSMTDFDGIIPEPLEEGKRLFLPPFSVADAFRVLTQQAANAGLGWPENLIGRMVADLKQDERVSPAELQMAGAALAMKGIDTEAEYDQAGGAAGLLSDYLDEVLFCFSDRSHPAAMLRLILNQFVTGTMLPQRVPRSLEEIAHRTGLPLHRVRQAIALLQCAGLIERVEDQQYYELAHDSLIKPMLKPEDFELRANRVLDRALARHNANAFYLIGLRDWLLVNRHVDREKRSQTPVRWLLGLSVIRIVVNFLLLFLAPIAVLAGLECLSAFPDKDVERDRILIRQGLPMLAPFVPRRFSIALDTGLQPDDFDKQKLLRILHRPHWEFGYHPSSLLEQPAFQEAMLPLSRDILRCQIDNPENARAAFGSLLKEMEEADTYTVEECNRAVLVVAEVVRLHPDLADQVLRLPMTANDDHLQLIETAIEAKLSKRENPLVTLTALLQSDENNIRLTALVDLLPAHPELSASLWTILKLDIAASDPALRGDYYGLLAAAAHSDPGLAQSMLAFLNSEEPRTPPKPIERDSETARQTAIYAIMGIRAAYRPAEALVLLGTLEAAIPKAQDDAFTALGTSLGLTARAKPALARRVLHDIAILLKRMSTQQNVPLAAYAQAGKALGQAVGASRGDPAAQSEALSAVFSPAAHNTRIAEAPVLTAFANESLPGSAALAHALLDYWLPHSKGPPASAEATPGQQQRTQVLFHVVPGLLRALTDPSERVSAADRMMDPLLSLLAEVEATFKPDGSTDLSNAIGECVAADPALASKCLPPLKKILAGKRETVNAHRFAAQTIATLARPDGQDARTQALDLLLGSDFELRGAAMEGWQGIVETEAESRKEPASFLLKQLDGEDSLLTAYSHAQWEAGSATTVAVYRRVVENAVANRLALEKSQTPESPLRRQVDDLMHDSRLHLRVSAFNILMTEGDLRWRAAHAD